MSVIINKVMSDQGFKYTHSIDEVAITSRYNVHSHDIYEIVIFLMGDTSFFIEGMEYPLNNFDVMISRPGEMHQLYHHSSASYERIVLTFTDAFFIDNECIAYRDIFTAREMGGKNIISGNSVKESFVPQIISRLEHYITEATADKNDTVIRCTLIELLHNLNKLTSQKVDGYVQNTVALKVSAYINQNLASDLSLDRLSEEFFISKYYLCHIFKKYFGMTVGQYITRKRILLAKKLYQSGQSLSEVASLSGFSDYSAFYKAFTKETGLSPKEGLRRFGALMDGKKRL